MVYNDYKNLIGRQYSSGKDDCYGLAMNFYRRFYGMELTDFARPDGWWNCPDFNLVSDMIYVDGWKEKSMNPRSLKPGDGLVFSLLQTGKANHLGVYIGNSLFLHHVQGRLSIEEALLPKWMNRLLHVLEHPVVVSARETNRPQTEFSTLLPSNVKRQILGDV